jgi:hypothetical protein
MYQNIPTKVLTGEVRLTFPHLHTPFANQPGADPKYSVTLLIPKSDVATYNEMKAAEEAAAQAVTGKLWNGLRPAVLESVIWDGDGVRKNGAAFGPGCKGHWVVTASTKNKPYVCHTSNVDVELLPQDVYSGMYARVIVNFFGYLNSGKKGVGCGLNGVMKTNEGEHLSGGTATAADFAGVGSSAPVYTPPPQQYAPPAQPQYAPPTPPQYGGVPAGAAAINPLTGQPV